MFKIVDYYGDDATDSEIDFLINADVTNSLTRRFFRIVEA